MKEYDLTLNQAFKKTVEEFPDKICLRLKEEEGFTQYSYQDVYNASLKLAYWLSSLGIKKGDRVALILENNPQWSICYFGIILAGATAIPIDIQATQEEVEYFLNDSESKVVFASSGIAYLSELEKLRSVEKVVLVGKGNSSLKTIPLSEILSLQIPPVTLPEVIPQDLASIVYTSGTTDVPKAVMLTHNNFYSNFLSSREAIKIKPNDHLLSILPLHHTYAFLATLIIPLLSAAKITYINTLRREEILKALRQEKITVMIVVPQVVYLLERGMKEKLQSHPFCIRLTLKAIAQLLWTIRRLTKINISKLFFYKSHSYFGKNLRLLVCGGAKLEEESARFFFKLGFKIVEGYGLTETSPVVSLNPLHKPKIGSVGKAISGVEVKILNPDERGVGEILIKGPNVMKGYYHNQEETKSVLKNGWFHSGDLGYLDKRGYLYIKGRVKEIIVLSSGKNISPQEVEAHYLKSLFIKEICILSDEKEQILKALVVPNFDYFKKMKEYNVYDIIKWNLEYLSQKLPSYKRIRSFILIEEDLPRTRLGKIKRFQAKEIYQKNISEKIPKEAKKLTKELSLTEAKVLDILKKERKLKTISLEDHLELDLGIDSLERIELMLILEKALNIKIKEEELADVFTVGELLKYLEERLPKERGALGGQESVAWADILSSPLPCDLRKRIGLKPGLGAYLFTFGFILLFDFILRVFFRLRVHSKANLSGESFILCPNHSSYLDAFIVFSSLPFSLRQKSFFIGLSKFFEGPIIKGLVPYLRVVPIDFSSNLIETMQAASFILKNKKNLCVFPEGVRSVDGELREFKKGVGILAKELNAPIIPVYIKGAHYAWKPTARFPKPYPIEVIFGKKYTPQELKVKGLKLDKEADDYQAISLGIKEEIRNLRQKV